MSGIETAGLILGAIPLIITALENYKKIYRGTVSWKHFRREFIQYQNEITIQTTFFSANIEYLLTSVTCTPSELRALLDEPAGPLWSEPRIEEKIRERLPSSFKTYMVLVSSVNSIIEEIMLDLNLVEGNADWRGKPLDAFRKTMVRNILRNLHNSDRLARVKELERKNEQLRDLLDSSDKLSIIRSAQKANSTTRLLKAVKESASKVHRLFVQCWECKVEGHQHSVSLYLENYMSSCVGLLDSEDHGWTAPLLLSVCVIEKNRTFNLTAKVAELSNVPPSASMPDCSLRNRNLAPARPQPSTSIPVPTRLQVCNLPARSAIPQMKKKVAFASRPPLIERRNPNHVQSRKIRELCGTIKSGLWAADRCGYLAHSEFGFALLSALDEKEAFRIAATKKETLGSIIGLKSTSKAATIVLTRLERLELAVRIAGAFMYFYGTPWLDGALTKEEIGFPTRDETGSSVLLDRPFISCNFPSSFARVSERTETEIRRSLLSLAFILLELCFGVVIPTNGLFKDQTTGTQYDLVTKWRGSVGGEFGILYADAIGGCLAPRFLAPSRSIRNSTELTDDALQEGVYFEIFMPLKQTLEFFTGKSA